MAPAIEIALKNHTDFSSAREDNVKLRRMLEERKLIERAKGILMEKSHLSEAEAMKKLQKLSNIRNLKIVDIAKEIINVNELF